MQARCHRAVSALAIWKTTVGSRTGQTKPRRGRETVGEGVEAAHANSLANRSMNTVVKKHAWGQLFKWPTNLGERRRYQIGDRTRIFSHSVVTWHFGPNYYRDQSAHVQTTQSNKAEVMQQLCLPCFCMSLFSRSLDLLFFPSFLFFFLSFVPSPIQ